MARRFARAGGPTGAEYILSANLVAHATPHTLGSWVEIDASVAEDCSGLWIDSNTVIGVSTVNTAMILELGFGAAAAEAMQVQVYVGGHRLNLPIYLPLHIPAGTRLSGRIQGAVTVDIFTPQVILEYCRGRFGWGGYTRAEAIGLNAATSAPTTGDLTDNAFDQAIASTTIPYKALTLHCGISAGVSTAATATAEIGIGAAASEQALGMWFFQALASEILQQHTGPRYIERDIAVGTRLSIRKNGTMDLTGHLIGWS